MSLKMNAKYIQKCSNGKLEADDENLIELLMTFDCNRTVTESTILQNVTECWRPILTALTGSFPTVESLISLFSRLIPTTFKVVSTVDFQPTKRSRKVYSDILEGVHQRA